MVTLMQQIYPAVVFLAALLMTAVVRAGIF